MRFDATPFLTGFLRHSSAIHLLDLSSDGRILSCNDAVLNALKRPRAEVEDCPIWGFLARGSIATLRKKMAESGEGRFLLTFFDLRDLPFSLECRIHPKPAGFLLMGEPPSGAGPPETDVLRLQSELAGLSRDNAERGKELERALSELKQAQAMLLHGAKMAALGQMTAGVAHEINNPLGFVLNNHEMLRQDMGDLLALVGVVEDALPQLLTACPEFHAAFSAKAAAIDLEYLSSSVPRKIAANIEGLERMSRIVSDLRTFSRLDEPDLKVCDLEENIRSTLTFLGPMMRAHNVAVETAFGPVGQVACFPGPLNQAISNVVMNAIQASQPGDRVRLATLRDGTEYTIVVEDHGSGIAPELAEKVFDPFFTTKPAGTGTGLGLSITYKAVAAHGGRIELSSTPGQGTTVRIRIPIAHS